MNQYVFGNLRYQVVGACVVALLSGGGETYVYQGGYLPPNTRLDQVTRLLAHGLVKEVE